MNEDLLCGIPIAYWNAVADSSRCLFLCGGLEPFTVSLVEHAQQISDCAVVLFISPRLEVAPLPADNNGRLLLAAADPQSFPLLAAHFDLVVSSWSLHCCADPQVHLREIMRVLKPGGSLLLADGLDAKGSPGQELHRSLHQLMLEMDQARTHKPRSLLSPAEIIELVHGCGFEDVQARKIVETAAILDERAVEILRGQAAALLADHYLKSLRQIPGAERRFGRRITALLQDLRSAPLELQSYLTARGVKPKTAEAKAAGKPAAKPRRKSYGGEADFLIADESAGYPQRFRELPDEFKPREKLIMHGPAALKNHELLAVLLVSGTTKENVLELSRRLIQEYGSRAIAQERSVRRLQETLSIGMNKACQIVAAFELGRRFFEEPIKKSPTILAADDAYEYLRDMAKFTKEHFRGLYLNTRNRVIRDEIISIGTLNMSVVHPREVFLPAVEFSAAAVILAHNHPSGDPTPSEEDLAITHQMVEAGKVMGIEVFDHLIIGEDSYVSLQQEGKLK